MNLIKSTAESLTGRFNQAQGDKETQSWWRAEPNIDKGKPSRTAASENYGSE